MEVVADFKHLCDYNMGTCTGRGRMKKNKKLNYGIGYRTWTQTFQDVWSRISFGVAAANVLCKVACHFFPWAIE